MTTVTVQRRDMSVKAKRLRREGMVPGVVCGKDIKEKLTIQIPMKEALKLIRENQKGGQVLLCIGDQKIHAIIKDYSYNAMTRQVEVFDFQALVKGEKIHTSVEVVLKNEMLADGVVDQELSEIHYRADSDHLLDTIILDFENLKGVRSMKVSDLEQFKDTERIPSNPDSVIFAVTYGMKEEAEADEDANVADSEATA